MIHDFSSSVIFPLRRSCFLGFHWYVMFLETVGSFHRFLPRLTSRLMRGGPAAMAPALRRVLAALLALPLSSAMTRPDGRMGRFWGEFGVDWKAAWQPATGQRGRGKGTRVEAMLRPPWAMLGTGLGQGEVGVIWSICQGDVRAACSQKWDARKHCKIPGWQGSAHSIVPCLGTCWGHVAEVCLRGRRQGPPGQGHGRWPDFQQTTFWK